MIAQSGSNEVELLEFTVGSNSYGINISKVSEIMQDCDVTPVPNSPEEVEGVFIPRDALITVIDLHKVLHCERRAGKSIFIVCRFNNMNIAFRVSGVQGFQRIQWSAISEPPPVAGAEGKGLSTGVAKIEDRIIMILDLEKIMSDISGGEDLDTKNMSGLREPDEEYSDKNIIIIDDSPFLNMKLEETARSFGFKNVISFKNGAEAWDYIQQRKNLSEDINKEIGCIISDIEMPVMDGLVFTKNIKSDPVLKKLPVILFSSLIDDRMSEKCIEVGADAQYSKPHMKGLMDAMLNLIKR
ncbi:MAG: chemotaxis protein [Oscillospiraceae bacterium]|nr:chemotaxis protein [Oscillospiraceae bacterium]